ncbi:MAG TPA: carbohydrate ABC transporter permease [Clostridiaceae bacterium]|nr:carbohydrate ABC transporter permease [Clostridiaceae bacterium]
MASINKRNDFFQIIIKIIFILLAVMFLFPFVYVFSASFSSPVAVAANPILIFPKEFTLAIYKIIFKYSSIWTGYVNSIFYTLVGTLINITFTITAAYALTRPELIGRRAIIFFIVLTMFINAGMIPNYLLVRDLGILNTRWALLLPVAVSQWNLFITRSYLEINIPNDLHDAAEVDGAGEFRYFFSVVLPLSTSIIAVIGLFYGSGHWNSFFNALIYLKDRNLYPLQLVLREILIQNRVQVETSSDLGDTSLAKLGVKYGVIVLSVAPLLIIFPFVQKYFVRGVMIGSLKG